jgi:hypothetical protein
VIVKTYTVVEFEPGDTIPDWVTTVVDGEGDTWTREPLNMFSCPELNGSRSWHQILGTYGPIRVNLPQGVTL